MGERCGFRAGGADRRRASAARLLSRPARSGNQEPEGVGSGRRPFSRLLGFRRCRVDLSPVTAIVEGAMTDSSFECNQEKIQAIEEAFDAAWAFIQANEPERDSKHDCERMTALSQKIAELSAEGITDPSELRRLALEAWPLWQEPMRAGMELCR